MFSDEILLNMIEIGGDAEEGGHQVQGEGNPKKKHQQNNIKGGKEGRQRYSWKCLSEVIWDLHYQNFLFD